MALLSPNKTLIIPSNPFSFYLQSKPKLFLPSHKSLTLSATSAHRLPSHKNWADFAARVSGEWEGFGAEFSAKGKPLELPESVVPEAFREWEVKLFDWQTQCPTLASSETSGGEAPFFFYKLIKLLPTVGCEAGAATRHSVDERVVGGLENNVLGFGFHCSGRYVCVGLVEKKVVELEHCFVNGENWEERLRVIQVVRLEEGRVSLEKIWVFWEHWCGCFRNGEQVGGCGVGESGFAATKAVEVLEVLGEWRGRERFAADGFEDGQKNPIHQLVKVQTQNSIRGQLCLTALPKNLWCSMEVKEDGDTWAEVGWLVKCGHAMTSRCVLHKDGRLKEMIIQEEAKVLDGKV